MLSLIRQLLFYLTASALAATGPLDCAVVEVPSIQAKLMSCHDAGGENLRAASDVDLLRKGPLSSSAGHDCVKKCQMPAFAMTSPDEADRARQISLCHAKPFALFEGIYVKPLTPPPRSA